MKKLNAGQVTFCIWILIILTALVAPSYFEMQTFNKFRSPGTPEATFFDALFSELRVDAK